MLRLVTLDATNTILKFRGPVAEQYAAIGNLYGLNPDPQKLTNSFRLTFKQLEKEAPNFGAEGLGWQKWWLSLVSGTFRGAACIADDATLSIVGHHLIKHFSSSAAYELHEGSVQLLEKISSKPVKVGIISNTDERLEGILVQLGIRHFFDFVITSYTVRSGKPNPEIFQAALANAGTSVNPEAALHIGDDLKRDYLGAKACGWNTILVSRNHQRVCEEAGITFDEASMFSGLKELMPVIESYRFPTHKDNL